MEEKILELEKRITNMETKMKQKEKQEKKNRNIRIVVTVISIILTLLCVITYYLILKHNIEVIMGGWF